LRDGELPQDMGATKCCGSIVELDPECCPDLDGIADVIDEWKEFIASSKVYQCYRHIGSVVQVFLYSASHNTVTEKEEFDTGENVVGFLGDEDLVDLLLPDRVDFLC
jgi:hypothetical protein